MRVPMLRKKSVSRTSDIVDKQLNVMNNAFIWISIIVIIMTIGLGLFSYLRIDSLQSQVDANIQKQDNEIKDALEKYDKRIDRIEDKLDERVTEYINRSNTELKDKISDFKSDFEKLAGETLKKPVLEILYLGSPLQGQFIESKKATDGWLDSPSIIIFNSGTKESTIPSINLSFSEDITDITGDWRKTTTSDPNYKCQYQLELNGMSDDLAVIKVGESDRFEPFRINLNSIDVNLLRCKLEIFYEETLPAVAVFSIKIN